ncbi:hypothetical protein M441DRAFT_315200 [Trichoderma asperellum CBS 433.97]|uniref:Uncharacterized protein n=1 Tax=Trichoderma asperellum (strain ATCC 204424 / CBS 433.97 / NBRC 101777) TaxID=1042311 RepID=A0A2T3ZKK4_TRIA4|nr:hypothetical protein M441DRAFT_315200 [Trichoderma asperellum CBS 433.97]PTB45341.1 hypothetical protein M441DRAFT_315200 [Trichoderma asperellum CBS 433.97]
MRAATPISCQVAAAAAPRRQADQMQQGTRDSESAPAVTVTVSFVWLGRLAVFSMRNTAKTLVFHRGAAGWSRLVGARKGVRLTPGGGAATSGGFIFGTGLFFPGRESKTRASKRDKGQAREEKRKKRKRKTSVVGQAWTVGKKLPDGSNVINQKAPSSAPRSYRGIDGGAASLCSGFCVAFLSLVSGFFFFF